MKITDELTETLEEIESKQITKPSSNKSKKKIIKPASTQNKSQQPVKVNQAVEQPKAVKLENNKTTFEEIWESIKDRELGLFGLKDQTIQKYCQPILLDSTKCTLKYKVSSVAPAVEAVVSDFDFEIVGGFIVISKK